MYSVAGERGSAYFIRIRRESAMKRTGFDRRKFLQLGATGLALPPALLSKEEGSAKAQPASTAGNGLLPGIPKPADLASDRLVHNFRDYFNPPAAHNEWGYLQAAKSVAGLTAISFPPFACCGVPQMPFSPGNLTPSEIFLNDRILTSYPPPAGQVAYTW